MAANDVTLQDVQAAAARIAGGVINTPCPESIPLSELCGARIFCKLDSLQRTGSFKERGARNALLQLDEQRRKRGVIAASAGNHASALAYHGRLLGIPVTVVMPTFAPLIKVNNCRKLGATVVLHGATFDDARAKAQSISKENQLTYVHGFDDPAIIAGQGTMGLEILEQVPNAEAIVVPVGGGGLLAGIAVAVKSLKPDVRVIGVESVNTLCMTTAMSAGAPANAPPRPTLADGLAVVKVGQRPYDLVKRHVDQVVTVSEDQIALAILRLVELEKIVVEGAAATPLAAMIGPGKGGGGATALDLAGKTVVLCLCGGNIDPNILGRVIDKGLVADGRLCRFIATISDRPGGLAKFASTVAAAGASVREVNHDRAFSGSDVSSVNVLCTIETDDANHVRRVFDALEREGIRVNADIG